MKAKAIFLLLVICIVLPSFAFARDMIYTYWHQLDNPPDIGPPRDH